MNFNLRIKDSRDFFNDALNYYYIGTRDEKAIAKVNSLSPVCIYGEDFKSIKKNIRAEYKKTENAQLEMKGALRERFSQAEKKINSMMEEHESIHRVYFHFNNEMIKPMVIVCLGVRTGALTGIEHGRVIVSGVDTVIEENHTVHGNRCDYYVGIWNYHQSKNGNDFVNVDMTRRQDEKPVAFRGKITK